MHLTVVRHAFAGRKGTWDGPDIDRPLDELGERQAAGLVVELGRRRVRRVISSPAARCRQTVAPLAAALGLPVELWSDLGPDAFTRWILTACIADHEFDNAVICTHGELLSPLLQRADIAALAQRDGHKRERLLTKGTAWSLAIAAGTVTKLTHVVPRVEE